MVLDKLPCMPATRSHPFGPPFLPAVVVSLLSLSMADPDFGWTAEMQVKAARAGVRYAEVPVSYRKRIGVSKITGTVSGSIRAGYKILRTVFIPR